MTARGSSSVGRCGSPRSSQLPHPTGAQRAFVAPGSPLFSSQWCEYSERSQWCQQNSHSCEDDRRSTFGATVTSQQQAFRDFLQECVRAFGTPDALAKQMGVAQQSIYRALKEQFTLSTENCLRLAVAVRASPERVLEMAGKANVANLIKESYALCSVSNSASLSPRSGGENQDETSAISQNSARSAQSVGALSPSDIPQPPPIADERTQGDADAEDPVGTAGGVSPARIYRSERQRLASAITATMLHLDAVGAIRADLSRVVTELLREQAPATRAEETRNTGSTRRHSRRPPPNGGAA